MTGTKLYCLTSRVLPDYNSFGKIWGRVCDPTGKTFLSFVLIGRYFCPAQTHLQYPKWEPWAVGQGVCGSISRSDLVGAPLPSGFKVLMYGNSHLRQVISNASNRQRLGVFVYPCTRYVPTHSHRPNMRRLLVAELVVRLVQMVNSYKIAAAVNIISTSLTCFDGKLHHQ